MARFDVYANRAGAGFLLDVQADLIARQFMAAVPQSELTMLVASLDRESDAIISAIDFLHHGW